MGQVGVKFGGKAWPVSQARTREVELSKETQTLTKNKKDPILENK